MTQMKISLMLFICYVAISVADHDSQLKQVLGRSDADAAIIDELNSEHIRSRSKRGSGSHESGQHDRDNPHDPHDANHVETLPQIVAGNDNNDQQIHDDPVIEKEGRNSNVADIRGKIKRQIMSRNNKAGKVAAGNKVLKRKVNNVYNRRKKRASASIINHGSGINNAVNSENIHSYTTEHSSRHTNLHIVIQESNNNQNDLHTGEIETTYQQNVFQDDAIISPQQFESNLQDDGEHHQNNLHHNNSANHHQSGVVTKIIKTGVDQFAETGVNQIVKGGNVQVADTVNTDKYRSGAVVGDEGIHAGSIGKDVEQNIFENRRNKRCDDANSNGKNCAEGHKLKNLNQIHRVKRNYSEFSKQAHNWHDSKNKRSLINIKVKRSIHSDPENISNFAHSDWHDTRSARDKRSNLKGIGKKGSKQTGGKKIQRQRRQLKRKEK